MSAGMVIVGAGECGGRAAFALREAGYAGPVTLIGSELHAPYERPPLSKEAITGETEPAPKHIAGAEGFAEHSIDLLTGREATAIDRGEKLVRLSDGSAIAYDKLLLATGATARRLPMAEAAGERCHTLRTFDDAVRMRGLLGPGVRLVIIGGGFIGLELAASARQRGAEATVIEAQPRILMRGVPEEIAEVISARHAEAGAEILAGQGIASISRSETGTVTVELAGGRRIEADHLVVGIGSRPTTELAEAAGLAIDNGIAVDTELRTSDPDIFAAGDCCSFPLEIYDGRRIRLESWRNAHDQGNHAAQNMLGAAEAFNVVPWFWSDQYDLGLQVAGLAEGAVRTVRRDLDDGFILFHLAADGRLLAASGIGRGNAVARDIRLAEMMIARQARPGPAELASPEVKLKKLLAA